MKPSTSRGILAALRRFSGVGAVLFALVLVVSTVRAHALALTIGDDDLCVTMTFTGAKAPAIPEDTTDLADRHHACCDLGLCLDAAALPPSAPPLGLPCRIVRRATPAVAPTRPRPRARRAGNRPRAPPSI